LLQCAGGDIKRRIIIDRGRFGSKLIKINSGTTK